jgi:hypothetical protein
LEFYFNLHLLNDSLNLSKSDKSLDDWIKNNNSGFISKDLLIDDSVPLTFDFLKIFIMQEESFKKTVY